MKFAKIILLLSCAMLLTGCNLVNVIKMRYANDDLTPVWPQHNTQAVIKAFYEDAEKPYIEVSVNGIAGFRFLIDTGASMSYVVESERTKGLNLNKGYSLSMSGWGDEEDSTLYQTEVASLSLSGVVFNNVNMAYLQASKTRYFARPDQATFDGVIGHDILRHFSWVFDKAANQVMISRLPYQPKGDENVIPFEVFFSKISIPVEVNFGGNQKVQQDFLIDTGSRHYAKVSAAYVNDNVRLSGTSVTGADFGLSGKTEHQRTTIPGLKIGEQLFSNVKVNLIGPDDDEDENWIIGNALLNQQISVIDYHSNVLYLLPNEKEPFQTKYNLTGLELRKILDGRFVLRYIMPDMAAAELDFAEGDLVYEINGQSAQDISLLEWLMMAAKPGEFEICRTRENNQCLTVQSEHIKGYSVR